MAVDPADLYVATVALLRKQFTDDEREWLADHWVSLEPVAALELLHGLSEDIAP